MFEKFRNIHLFSIVLRNTYFKENIKWSSISVVQKLFVFFLNLIKNNKKWNGNAFVFVFCIIIRNLKSQLGNTLK